MLTGQVTELKADKVMWAAVIDVLVKRGETYEISNHIHFHHHRFDRLNIRSSA
jgi:hypothetical protein